MFVQKNENAGKKCTFNSVFQGKIEFVLQNVQVLPFLSYFLNNIINHSKKARKTMQMYMFLMILYPFLRFFGFFNFSHIWSPTLKNAQRFGP